MNDFPPALEPLTKLHRWVIWRDVKGTKEPYQSKHPTRRAMSNKAATWSTYDEAVSAAPSSDGGIGFVIGAGIGAFDLDDCRNKDTGELDEWADDLVTKAESYSEVTPSKNGMRVIGFTEGDRVHTDRKMPVGKVQIFRGECGRYITITGDQAHGTLRNIDALIDEYVASDEPRNGKMHKEDRIELPDVLPTVDLETLPPTVKKALNDCRTKDDASDRLMSAAGAMVREGYEDAEIAAVLMTKDHPVSEHVYTKRIDGDQRVPRRSEKEQRRIVRRAIAKVRDEVSEHEARFKQLASLDPVEYDQQRAAVAKNLGIRVGTLDEEVAQRRKRKARHADAAPIDIEKLAVSAKSIIACEDVLQLFAKDFAHLVTGEEANAKLIYLVGTSRLFGTTMHAAIKGPSAGGKSELRKRVLSFFPPESVIAFTALSEKALLYFKDEFSHKILSMGEASATEEQAFQNYLLRELMSEGVLRYQVPMKVDGVIETVPIEKKGPVAFIVTTTRSKLDPENETRMLSLEVDDSEDQTRAVIAKVAEVVGLNNAASKMNVEPWRDFQRWLAAGKCDVTVPFAEKLGEQVPPKSVRLRRDFGQVLLAIKAHALLHQQYRERDQQGRVVATIDDDYKVVRRLMWSILSELAGVKIREEIIETIEAVRKLQPTDETKGVKVLDIAKELNLDRSTASRRLRSAEWDDFIVNLEPRKGYPKQFRTTDQALPKGVILPRPDDL